MGTRKFSKKKMASKILKIFLLFSAFFVGGSSGNPGLKVSIYAQGNPGTNLPWNLSPYQTIASLYQTPNSPVKKISSPYQTPNSPYQTITSPYQTPNSPYQTTNSPYQTNVSPYQKNRSPYQTNNSLYQETSGQYQTKNTVSNTSGRRNPFFGDSRSNGIRASNRPRFSKYYPNSMVLRDTRMRGICPTKRQRFSKYFPRPKCSFPENPVQYANPVNYENVDRQTGKMTAAESEPAMTYNGYPAPLFNNFAGGHSHHHPGFNMDHFYKDHLHINSQHHQHQKTFPPSDSYSKRPRRHSPKSRRNAIGKCSKKPNFQVNGLPFIVTALDRNCTKMTWREAYDFCKSASNYELLSFETSSVELEQVEDLMKASRNFAPFWIGAQILERQPGALPLIKWKIGGQKFYETTEPVDYETQPFWAPAKYGGDGRPQPDNYSLRSRGFDRSEENCVGVLRTGPRGIPYWHDLRCEERLNVICEAPSISEDISSYGKGENGQTNNLKNEQKGPYATDLIGM